MCALANMDTHTRTTARTNFTTNQCVARTIQDGKAVSALASVALGVRLEPHKRLASHHTPAAAYRPIELMWRFVCRAPTAQALQRGQKPPPLPPFEQSNAAFIHPAGTRISTAIQWCSATSARSQLPNTAPYLPTGSPRQRGLLKETQPNKPPSPAATPTRLLPAGHCS